MTTMMQATVTHVFLNTSKFVQRKPPLQVFPCIRKASTHHTRLIFTQCAHSTNTTHLRPQCVPKRSLQAQSVLHVLRSMGDPGGHPSTLPWKSCPDSSIFHTDTVSDRLRHAVGPFSCTTLSPTTNHFNQLQSSCPLPKLRRWLDSRP